MLVGYARVSTMDQNPALQMDALREAGCKRIFPETASGSHRSRPQLEAALNYLREGDT
ncbi:MAG: recombinase family protein, partial [Gammaproteobacteria bacterium]|nr:recombinase family protein [Gammaproteobacteria bacterium]